MSKLLKAFLSNPPATHYLSRSLTTKRNPNIQIRMSQGSDTSQIRKLLYEDFLQNEPIARILQITAEDCKVYFESLLGHPFTKEHSICAYPYILFAKLKHLTFDENLNTDATVGIDKDSDIGKFRAIIKQTKTESTAIIPKGCHTLIRHELISVPINYGGCGVGQRMCTEGLDMLIKKVPEIQFSWTESTSEYSFKATSKVEIF
uniref:Macro domain-containing protein n=1 Tax=Rhabditophanes sp. KR3021 TaxID=114890 RepID=A0AC35UD77_9BILA